MNSAAERHLAKAEGYIEKGNDWYAKAADEIVAAMEADPSLTQREVGEYFGHSSNWVSKLVAWRASDSPGTPPFRQTAEQKGRGAVGVQNYLSDAPLEEIERIVEKLPAKAAAKVAQASLAKPGVTREIAKDAEASATVTRASGQVRDEMVHKAKTRSSIGKTSGLGLLVDVLGNLHGAKRRLSDSYKAAGELDLSDDHAEAVAELLDEIVLIIDWYRSYLDSGDQSFDDELAKLLSNN